MIRSATAGHWTLPKGRMERDETIIQTAVREISEETGMKNVKLSEEYFSQTYPTVFNTIKTVHLFNVEIEKMPKEIFLSDAHDEYKWMDMAEFLREASTLNFNKAAKQAVDYLQEKN